MRPQALTATLMMGAALAFLGTPAVAARADDAQILAKAAHEIRMYHRYTIFDHVALQVRDGNIELTGQVSRPFKRKDLERLMQRVPGTTAVTNRIEVLPVSFFDDELRVRVARAVYWDPALSRYSLQAVGPIHIIVNNGEVTLEGVVSTQMEKQIAGMRAASAGLSLGPVVNNLRVERPAKKA